MKETFTISVGKSDRNYNREIVKHILNKPILYNTISYSVLTYNSIPYSYKSSYINLCRSCKDRLLYFKFTLRDDFDGKTEFKRVDTTIDLHDKHIKLNGFNSRPLGIIQIIQFLKFCLKNDKLNEFEKDLIKLCILKLQNQLSKEIKCKKLDFKIEYKLYSKI